MFVDGVVNVEVGKWENLAVEERRHAAPPTILGERHELARHEPSLAREGRLACPAARQPPHLPQDVFGKLAPAEERGAFASADKVVLVRVDDAEQLRKELALRRRK